MLKSTFKNLKICFQARFLLPFPTFFSFLFLFFPAATGGSSSLRPSRTPLLAPSGRWRPPGRIGRPIPAILASIGWGALPPDPRWGLVPRPQRSPSAHYMPARFARCSTRYEPPALRSLGLRLRPTSGLRQSGRRSATSLLRRLVRSLRSLRTFVLGQF